MNILDDLEFRGLTYQVTDRDGLAERLASGPITLYNGFDPTSDSMTVGNLVTILLLRRFQLAGHRAIALIGGGTGLIGDPGGKRDERSLNPEEVVRGWVELFKRQLEPYLDFTGGANPARLVDNYDWLGQVRAIELLRNVGKHFPVPYMLAKDSVAARLETGISYTEFSYMILQSYDFLQLNEAYGCELQTGGSDQWGNITAGVDLIRRATGRRAFGLTCPLVTKADGAKFGKSEGGAVWLDAAKTTPYQFYQFWVNAEDQKVGEYLRFYTFLDRAAILDLDEAVRSRPDQREAQRTLADEVTTLVHGAEATRRAERISRALFYGDFRDLTEEEIREGFHDVPTCRLEGTESSLIDLLVASGASPSKRQARQDVQSGAVYLNGERCADLERVVRRQDGLHGRYHILRRGKKSYYLVD
ncbi:MAG: tyrosine--tRNA ligase [Candidatus Latescibacterota bacterium]